MAARHVLTILSGSFLTAAAQAEEPRAPCMMTVLAPATALENPHAVMGRGTRWGPATQMRIARADGRVSYCAHGDYCFPAAHLRFVTPCTPDAIPMPASAGDTERLYGLHG